MTTNNHPAHGPLSNYRLHRIREILGKAAAQSDGGNIGYAMSDAVKAIDELLAGRKVEPVAFINGAWTLVYYRPPKEAGLKVGDKLYTSPPVPVAIDERAAFNAWNNGDNLPIAGVGAKNAAWLAWQARAKLGSPTAPVVPDDRAITQHFDAIALETAREIMCDVNRRHEFLGGEIQLLSRIQCRIDEAFRAATLNGGKS